MPRLPPSRGAFHRGRPPPERFRASAWRACPGWPARAGAARVHRGPGTATRPLFVRSSRAPSRPRALCATSASGCLREHDHGPLEHPDPRGARSRRLPGLARKSPSERSSRRSFSRSGVGLPMPDVPGRDCSRPRLRPNPDRSEHLVSQAPSPAGLERRGRGNGAADAERACNGAPAGRAV